MRKIIVSAYITLDGVIQAAGGPEEDFKYGGWSAPYYDEALDEIAEKQNNLRRTFFWVEKPLRFLPPSGLNMKTFGLVSMMSQSTSCPRP